MKRGQESKKVQSEIGVKGASLKRVMDSLTPMKQWEKQLLEYMITYIGNEEIPVTSPDTITKLKLKGKRNSMNTMKVTVGNPDLRSMLLHSTNVDKTKSRHHRPIPFPVSGFGSDRM